MRFFVMYTPSKETAVGPPSPEMLKSIEEDVKSGKLIANGGWLPSSKGARVRYSGGKLSVVDGPFTESKELIGGFAILELKSKEEAIESAKRFIKLAGEGECEIRQLRDGTPEGC